MLSYTRKKKKKKPKSHSLSSTGMEGIMFSTGFGNTYLHKATYKEIYVEASSALNEFLHIEF